MKRIVMLMPVWKRANIFKVVCENNNLLLQDNRIKLHIVFVLSPDDPELDEIEGIIYCLHKETSVTKLYFPNLPLGEKMNFGIDYIVKNMEYDYLMNIGSDDLLHRSIIDLYLPYMQENTPYFGLDKLYFVNQTEAVHFSYYNRPNLVGAGRMIHKQVVEAVLNKFGMLYDGFLNRGLDTNSAKKIIDCKFNHKIIDGGDFPFIVDQKGDVNINSFTDILRSKNNTHIKRVNINIVNSVFSIY